MSHELVYNESQIAVPIVNDKIKKSILVIYQDEDRFLNYYEVGKKLGVPKSQMNQAYLRDPDVFRAIKTNVDEAYLRTMIKLEDVVQNPTTPIDVPAVKTFLEYLKQMILFLNTI